MLKHESFNIKFNILPVLDGFGEAAYIRRHWVRLLGAGPKKGVFIMKILVVPDLHLKWQKFQEIENLLPNYDNVIFLGDYFDDWGCEKNVGLYNKMCEEMDKFAARHPDAYWCWGNHDILYLNPYAGWCSGHSPYAEHDVHIWIKEFADKVNIKYVHNIEGTLFSHAGIDKDIFDENATVDEMVNDINGWSPRAMYWREWTPVWARPGYSSYIETWQVVGHTPYEDIVRVQNTWIYDIFSYPGVNHFFAYYDTEKHELIKIERDKE